jgi:ankyrin repeat protein
MTSAKLSEAAFREDHAKVRELLQEGANPDGLPEDDLPPIHAAVEQLNLPIVQMLLDAGADPNLKDRSLWTPLYRAVDAACDAASQRGASHPDPEGLQIILALLHRGANVNIRSGHDGTDRTSAWIARKYGQTELAEQLENLSKYQPAGL